MTSQHEDHLSSLIEAFTEAVIYKYRKGVDEHGGQLWDLPELVILDEAINEAVDQFVYLMTLKQKMLGKI